MRKYVFNYHTYRAYMNGLILTNEMVREQLKNEWEKAEMERAARDDQLHEVSYNIIINYIKSKTIGNLLSIYPPLHVWIK